jgi:hypothetical protein
MMFEPGIPRHIQESRAQLLKEFKPRPCTQQKVYADGWDDAYEKKNQSSDNINKKSIDKN